MDRTTRRRRILSALIVVDIVCLVAATFAATWNRFMTFTAQAGLENISASISY